MVHRLEGDHGQPPIDGGLCQLGVLHAMRPAPGDLTKIEFGEILSLNFGQQDDIAAGDELFPGADSADEFGQRVVCGPKPRAVALLEEDPAPNPMVDLDEVRRMNRQSALVRLARVSENA